MGDFIKNLSPELLDLAQLKAYRYSEIDNKTGELVGNGFTYAAKVFSLSQNAQINILGLDNSRLDPAIVYPIEYNTIDDLDSYNVVDADDLHAMYLTALGTKKAVIDSGTVIKDQIRTAIDIAAVNAIVDNR